MQPDIVVLAGDLIDDDPYFTPKLLTPIALLDPSTPVLGVLGNHEMYGDPRDFINRLRGSRIRLLVNEGMPIRDLWIAGVSDYAATAFEDERDLVPSFDAALAQRNPSSFPLVLAHQPRAFAESKRRNIAVTLVAHTHGGQLGIRPLGWSLAGLFLRYHMGLYREENAQLYVNTGTGYWLVPFRLGMTPEITLIELLSVSPRFTD